MVTRRGFTLIELLVVMSVVALLASLAAPRYFRSLEKGREVILRSSLSTMRDAIDQHLADRNRYPDSLQALVTAGYLRAIPEDPMTGRRDTWIEVKPTADDGIPGGMRDVRSAAPGQSIEGEPFAAW